MFTKEKKQFYPDNYSSSRKTSINDSYNSLNRKRYRAKKIKAININKNSKKKKKNKRKRIQNEKKCIICEDCKCGVQVDFINSILSIQCNCSKTKQTLSKFRENFLFKKKVILLKTKFKLFALNMRKNILAFVWIA